VLCVVAGCGSAARVTTTAVSGGAIASPSSGAIATSPATGPSPSPLPSPSRKTILSSTAPSPTTEPTNTYASTGGLIDLQGPWTTFPDRRGDASPAIDITAVSLANVGKYATTRFEIAHLNWTGSFHVFLSRGDDEEGYMFVNLIAHPDHTITVQTGGGSRSTDYFPVKCPGIATRYDVTLEEVLLQVPWSCIPPKEESTVQFGPGTNMSGWVRGADDEVNTHSGLQAEALIPRTP